MGVMKSIKIAILTVCLFIAVGTFYLVWVNYQCSQYLQGVSDEDLQKKEGIFILKTTGKPYTGKVYATVCGGECGFMSCALIHWRADYKDGMLHGTFDAPISGVGDKHWFSPGDKTQTYIYENGTRIK